MISDTLQCPYWLPRDPRVLYKDRKQCIFRAGHDGYHGSDAYGFVPVNYEINELEEP